MAVWDRAKVFLSVNVMIWQALLTGIIEERAVSLAMESAPFLLHQSDAPLYR